MRLNRLSKIINIISLFLILAAGLFLFPLTEKASVKDSQNLNRPAVDWPVNKSRASIKASGSLPVASDKEEGPHLLFFGDLMLDRNVAAILKNKNLDLLLEGLASSTDFKQFDLVGANLEGAVTNKGEHYSPEMGFDFAFLPDRVAQLKSYNFSYFTIANNHITDQGAKGLGETRKNLSDLEFNYSGDADAQISSSSLTQLVIHNQKISLVAFSMVYHNFDLTKAKELIGAAKKESAWVIVNIHWGNEYQHNHSASQQKIAHEFIESGADIIIGHHPHVVQGIEIYKNRPIFYSLGNFIFDQYFSPDTQEGLGVELDLQAESIGIKLIPLSSRKSAPSLMGEEKKVRFLENLAAWSQADESLKAQIKAQTINIAK